MNFPLLYSLLIEKHSVENLKSLDIRKISSDMENVEAQNFDYDYQSDARDIEDDRSMRGFIGYGIFDENKTIQGYIYGYYLTNDEYSDYNHIDFGEINFLDEPFKNFIASKNDEPLGSFVKRHFSQNSIYVSNFAVNRTYRIGVYHLLESFVNECRSKNIEFLFFDALPDTIKILRPERLSRHGMRILAEVETYGSKLMVIKI